MITCIQCDCLVERAMMATFTAVFKYTGEWWIAYLEELPGANT